MSVSVVVQVGPITLRDREVSQVEVREELGAHCTCSVAFAQDARSRLQLQELLGEPIQVSIGGVVNVAAAGAAPPTFVGVVSGGSHRQHFDGGSSFSLSAVSRSLALEYRNTAYFPASTLVGLADALGAAVVGQASPRKLEYVQYGESDFAFLVRVAEENGFFVQTSGGQPELHARFVDGGVQLLWGKDLESISAVAHPVNHGFKGAFYDPLQKHYARLKQVRQAPAWLGGAQAIVDKLSSLAEDYAGGGDPQVEEFPARASTVAEFDEALRHKSARLLGNAVRVEGSSTHTGVRAGHLCTIRNPGGVRHPITLEGRYGVIRVTHSWDGDEYHNRFVATPWAGFTRMERPPRRLIPGPVSAEVVQNEDPRRMGRIRVRFAWQDQGVAEATRWVRMAVPHSGNGRGFAFVPEVGDEVLVAFEQGDPERPVVIGALWNGRDLAPPQGRQNQVKRIVTRSGNTIELVDEPGSETIEIHSARGTCFFQMANAAGGKPLITLRSEGDISIEAEGEIRMKCNHLTERVSQNAGRFVGQNDTVRAGQNAVVKAGMNVAVEGTNATVSASANLISKAGAANNIAGAMVHIQPPGLAAAPVRAQEPAAPQSVWKAKEVPKLAVGKSTGGRLRRG